MSAFAIAFVVMLIVSIVAIAAAAVYVAIRIRRLAGRIQSLQEHPTIVSARGFQAVAARADALRSKVEPFKERWDLISSDIAALMEASAAFRLHVGRASFATGLLLQTFVPTLRGSMSDPVHRG